ncbi:MAG: type 1 glutamine amidotransferase [Phycisphaeraceae bacterium]|nr:type 1 glutamine amidotransferase [Phycisphaeraceae bacterium]
MSLLVFQHHPDEDPCALGAILRDQGHRLRVIELFEGDSVPVDFDDVEGILSLGGPMGVHDTAEHDWLEAEADYLRQAHERGLPIVGVCLGAQLLAHALGGTVEPMETPEIGWSTVKLGFPGTVDPMYAGIPWETTQFHLHGDQVVELPDDGTPLAGSKACRTQAFKVGLTAYGFQYHFEWDQATIDRALEFDLVTGSDADVSAIRSQTEDHLHGYRRLGDRLSERIGLLLFPQNRRAAAV